MKDGLIAPRVWMYARLLIVRFESRAEQVRTWHGVRLGTNENLAFDCHVHKERMCPVRRSSSFRPYSSGRDPKDMVRFDFGKHEAGTVVVCERLNAPLPGFDHKPIRWRRNGCKLRVIQGKRCR